MGSLSGVDVILLAMAGGYIVAMSGYQTHGVIYAVAATQARNTDQAVLLFLVALAFSFSSYLIKSLR